MARRRSKETVSVSLFPFLSILACVIGVLTLMIVALALGQMDTSVIEQAKEYQDVRSRLTADKEEIESVQALRRKAEKVRRQLQDTRAELKRLQEARAAAIGNDELLARLAVEAKRLQDRIAELEPELKRLQEEIKKLQAELSQRKVASEAKVKILPGGSGFSYDPTFVECTANGIVIYDGPQPRRVRRADLRSNKTFLALLDRIANTKNATVTFLVRTDGVGAYHTARYVARTRYAHNGKLAVTGQGKIDLSLFK